MDGLKVTLEPEEWDRVVALLGKVGVRNAEKLDPEAWIEANFADLLDQAERLAGNPMIPALVASFLKG